MRQRRQSVAESLSDVLMVRSDSFGFPNTRAAVSSIECPMPTTSSTIRRSSSPGTVRAWRSVSAATNMGGAGGAPPIVAATSEWPLAVIVAAHL